MTQVGVCVWGAAITTITFTGPAGYDFDWDLAPIAAGTITTSTATTVVIAFNGDETMTLTGSFSGGGPGTRPTDGTIDVITWNDTGESTVIETSISVADFFTFLDANDDAGLVAQLLAGDDTINGSVGNDTLIGQGGNDQISTGGGADTVNTGAGDDTIILNGVRTGGSINGGDDNDTIAVSMAAAVASIIPGDLYSIVGLTGAMSGVETVRFDSQAGQRLRVQVGSFQMGDIAALTGGAGSDQLQVLVLSNLATTFVLEPLTLTGWNSDDTVMLVGVSQTAVGTPPASFTLDSSAYGGSAVLVGQGGNDTLTSGAGNDFVLTGGGADTVNTGAGDDTIVLNGSIAAGSSFNGGDDEDTVVFSGASTDYAISAVAGESSQVQVGNALIIDIEHLEFTDGAFHWDTTSGLVADGYLAGATVWIDDGNGVLDPYEPFAITDANGDFELSSYLTGPLLAMGGINIDTGLANDIVMSAPEGSSVINPLTTLVQTIIATASVDADTAQDQVKAALGLDASLDLTTLDLIAAASGGNAAALDAQKAAASVAKVLDSVVDSGGDPAEALGTLAAAITAAAEQEGSVNLADEGLLTEVYADAGVPAGDIGQLVTQTQTTIENIREAQSLDDISNVQAGDLVVITGGNGKDDLTGTDANERISSGNGSDVLLGNGGSDLLLGGNGPDILDGGAGNDVIVGGRGADIAHGGAGSDIFIFAKGDSSTPDIVKDFAPGTDWLYLAAGVTILGSSEADGSTRLALSDGRAVILEGVTGVTDHHSLVIQNLPLWAQTWNIA